MALQGAQRCVKTSKRTGRPLRYDDGWDSADTRIYLSKPTLSQWRIIRSEYDLRSDNDVAIFLLERFSVLKELQSRSGEQHSFCADNG